MLIPIIFGIIDDIVPTDTESVLADAFWYNTRFDRHLFIIVVYKHMSYL